MNGQIGLEQMISLSLSLLFLLGVLTFTSISHQSSPAQERLSYLDACNSSNYILSLSKLCPSCLKTAQGVYKC